MSTPHSTTEFLTKKKDQLHQKSPPQRSITPAEYEEMVKESLETLKGTSRTLRSYLSDLMMMLGLAVPFVFWKILYPHQRLVDQSPAISFPFTERDAVPGPFLPIITFLIPLTSISIISTLLYSRNANGGDEVADVVNSSPSLMDIECAAQPYDSVDDLEHIQQHHQQQQQTSAINTPKYNLKMRIIATSMGLLFALLLSIQVTHFIKHFVGRPRPDFLSRCAGDPRDFSKIVFDHRYKGGIKECPNPNKKVVKDGRRSFPSGHSSSSFAGLGFLGIWMLGQLNAMDGRGRSWRTMVSMVPLAAATYISLSRIQDYRHHWDDVLVGSLIGIICALVGHLVYVGVPRVLGNEHHYQTMDGNSSTIYKVVDPHDHLCDPDHDYHKFKNMFSAGIGNTGVGINDNDLRSDDPENGSCSTTKINQSAQRSC